LKPNKQNEYTYELITQKKDLNQASEITDQKNFSIPVKIRPSVVITSD